MNKDIKKLLLVLVFFAFADGIFYNFEELWMASNNLSINTISTVLSLCALISLSVIFLSSNIIKPNKLKKFVVILMIIKIILLLLLFVLNNSGLNILIKFIIMIEFAIDAEVTTSIYPLMTLIEKNDKTYAIKGLLYDMFYYCGVILVGIILGKTILSYTIDYNTYCIMSAVFMIIATIILINIKMDKYVVLEKDNTNNDILFKLIKEIKKDKISIYYLLFLLFGNIAYYTLMGILLTILTKELEFAPSMASTLKVGIGIFAVLLGTLILMKLTMKNNYANIAVKYVGRLITYLFAIVFYSKITVLIAILYTGLTSSAYAHITDAPYINRFDSESQLAFANLREMMGYFSRAVGTFLCGVCFVVSLRLNFIVASLSMCLTITFAFLALHNLNIEKRKNK